MVETGNSEVAKVHITVPWSLLKEFDELIKRHGYDRSEAVREGMRTLMEELRKRERHKGLAEGGTG